jgi:hypothetical protein
MLIDKRTIGVEEEPEFFGVWSWKDPNTIRNIETIDERRFKYNMLTLKDQAVIKGYVLPDLYELTTYPDGYFYGVEY